VHCKTRKVRVTRIESNDYHGYGPVLVGDGDNPLAGTTSVVLRGEDGTFITIQTKNKNVGKFPTVGEEVTADIYLRPIQAE
jgi:hypothetical protein